MGIPQLDHSNKSGVHALVPHTVNNNKNKSHHERDQEAPKIPPRMKKQGPEIPEKPPHLRLATLTKRVSMSSSQKPMVKESSVPDTSLTDVLSAERSQNLFLSNVRKKSASIDREILVAATKGSSRERPAEKRQREPAKLLAPVFNGSDDLNENVASVQTLLGLTSPNTQRKNTKPTNQILDTLKRSSNRANTNLNSPRTPVILIPRSQLDTRNIHQFYNYPMSYSVWVQNSGSGDPQVTSRLIRRAFSPNGTSTVELRPSIVNHNNINKNGKKGLREQQETKIFVNSKKSNPSSGTSAKQRSSSVTRSGSLTSHGSTSSDSGNETFPKSVLKKHRRETSIMVNNNNNKKNADQKKNVTFNAFATVQLMEE